MQQEKMGDLKDFWKGRILDDLQPVLNSPVVIPMVTDPGGWDTKHIECYARLLRIPNHRVLQGGRLFRHEERAAYFRTALCGLHESVDIMLDPDTGVARMRTHGRPTTCTAKKNAQKNGTWNPSAYVFLDDIDGMCTGCRIVAVYSERREKLRDLETNLKGLGSDLALGGTNYCLVAYRGTGAAMIFISRDCSRLQTLTDHLTALMSPVECHRITSLLQV